MSRKKRRRSIPRRRQKKHFLEGKEFIGILDLNRRGTGFVTTAEFETDILISPHHLQFAAKGDKVKVEILKVINQKKIEGKITKVVERQQTEFIGNVEVKDNFAFFIADHGLLPFDIFIPIPQLNGALDRDKVRVKITNEDRKRKSPEGKVVEILNDYTENDLVMEDILLQEGFPLHFPEKVIEQANELSFDVEEEIKQGRKDFRKVPTYTIDPKDAKDFDDALSIQFLDNGNVEVGIHIADVSHFVKLGAAIDEEAYKRATSVYLPDRVLPMLPEIISNDICSLRPKEDRLAFSVVLEMDQEANIQQYWIGETVIHSDYRFAYQDVQVIIDEHNEKEYPAIYKLFELSQHLRTKRFKNGAVNFSSKEIKIKLDEFSTPIGVEILENLSSHHLIEEFMLLANITVAEHIQKIKINEEPVNFPYRVHDTPNEEKLANYAGFIKRFGYQINIDNPEVTRDSFNALLHNLEGKAEQNLLQSLAIRTMAKAKYSNDNIGHYGLGVENYGHFTSPIRRYPDIMAHRIIKYTLQKRLRQDKKMEEKCEHCSAQESKAADAERSAIKYKQVEYMSQFLGEELEAIISGVASFGFWAETVEQKCEGFVSVREIIPQDEYEMVEELYALMGRYNGQTFQIGDKVLIQVVHTDLEKRQIDFALIDKIKE